jgi:hypothetical protein
MVFVSEVLAGELVGFQETDDGLYEVYCTSGLCCWAGVFQSSKCVNDLSGLKCQPCTRLDIVPFFLDGSQCGDGAVPLGSGGRRSGSAGRAQRPGRLP